MESKRLVRSSVESLSRLAETKAEVASGVDPTKVTRQFDSITRPGSPTKAMRKLGVALIAAPDPISAVPGVALIAGSVIMKKREPTNLDGLAKETQRILRDLQSLSL